MDKAETCQMLNSGTAARCRALFLVPSKSRVLWYVIAFEKTGGQRIHQILFLRLLVFQSFADSPSLTSGLPQFLSPADLVDALNVWFPAAGLEDV